LAGQAYWWLNSENGQRAMWPIPASWIRPNHDMGPWKQWDITPGGDGEPITRPASEILYFYHPDPIRPDATTSPTDAMSDSIEADESMELSKRVSFDNAVWPGMALIVGSEEGQEGESSTRPEIGWEQKRVMIDRIKQYYAGVVNKDEPLILDAVIQDVKMLTRGPRELDFMQSGKSTKERITQAYGVNPIVMGQIEGVNRASAVEARRLLADFAVNPIIELLNATMAKRLTPMISRGGIKTYAWIEPYRPDDADQTRADWVAAQRAKAVTRNEWRTEILGLPARDGWDDVVLTGSEIPIPAGMTNRQAAALLRNASE
jgi:phage portal protein BeeE